MNFHLIFSKCFFFWDYSVFLKKVFFVLKKVYLYKKSLFMLKKSQKLFKLSTTKENHLNAF